MIAYARVRFYPIFFAVRSAFTTFVSMNWKKLSLLVLLLLVADQALKIWIKTHLALGEAIIVCPDWFQLRFIENPGIEI